MSCSSGTKRDSAHCSSFSPASLSCANECRDLICTDCWVLNWTPCLLAVRPKSVILTYDESHALPLCALFWRIDITSYIQYSKIMWTILSAKLSLTFRKVRFRSDPNHSPPKIDFLLIGTPKSSKLSSASMSAVLCFANFCHCACLVASILSGCVQQKQSRSRSCTANSQTFRTKCTLLAYIFTPYCNTIQLVVYSVRAHNKNNHLWLRCTCMPRNCRSFTLSAGAACTPGPIVKKFMSSLLDASPYTAGKNCRSPQAMIRTEWCYKPICHNHVVKRVHRLLCQTNLGFTWQTEESCRNHKSAMICS